MNRSFLCCFSLKGCPSTASVCMMRKNSDKVFVLGVTSTQKMSIEGGFALKLPLQHK